MDNNKLFLRFADEHDMDLLLEWANDKDLRANSFNTEQISEESHQKWFHKIMNSDKIKLWIMMNGNIPVGQIRLEVANNSGIISYSIATKHRGLGYGKIILKLLEGWITDNFDTEFTAIGLVKTTNNASMHIFETANYEKNECNEYIKYLKKINSNIFEGKKRGLV